MERAISEAKLFVTRAIANHFAWSRDAGSTSALNHFL